MSLFNPKIDRVQEIPIASLAYLGDAIYELFIRLRYLQPPQNPHMYHQLVVAMVRAESQANQLDRLELTDAESDIVRRGRNAAGAASRSLDPAIYQKATGFEALIGYLYLTDPDRLDRILSQTNNANEIQR